MKLHDLLPTRWGHDGGNTSCVVPVQRRASLQRHDAWTSLDIDRLFETFFGAPAGWPGARSGPAAPAINVTASDTDLVVEAELPGLAVEDIDVQLADGVLTISGERKETGGGDGALYRETRYGRFSRSVTLPETVDADSAKAAYRDGILSVSIAKDPAHAPAGRRIPVATD
jgi:HSP20 family protein